jgi:hypothetical protein
VFFDHGKKGGKRKRTEGGGCQREINLKLRNSRREMEKDFYIFS